MKTEETLRARQRNAGRLRPPPAQVKEMAIEID
jgi:hypothetical protein